MSSGSGFVIEKRLYNSSFTVSKKSAAYNKNSYFTYSKYKRRLFRNISRVIKAEAMQ